MAAVICNAVSDVCTVIGKACYTPCRPIVQQCHHNPFCAYLTVTVILNTPPLIMGLLELPNTLQGALWGENENKQKEEGGGGGCSHRASMWLSVNSVFCFINLLVAYYVVHTVLLNRKNDVRLHQEGTMLSRIVYLLCYDPVIAVYILILMGFFIWLWIGFLWKVQGKFKYSSSTNDYDYNNNDEYDESSNSSSSSCSNPNVTKWITVSLSCGWFYFSMGFATICLSLCMAGCDGTDYYNYSSDNNNNNNNNKNDNDNDLFGAGSAGKQTATTTDHENARHEYSPPTLYSAVIGTAPQPTATSGKNTMMDAPISSLGSGKESSLYQHPATTTAAAASSTIPTATVATPLYERDVNTNTNTTNNYNNNYNSNDDESFEEEVAAAQFGSEMGNKISALFHITDDKRRSELESRGIQTSVAVRKGLSSAKQFVASKFAGGDNKT